MSGYFQRLAQRSGLLSVVAPQATISPLEVDTVQNVAAPATVALSDAAVPARPQEQVRPAVPVNESTNHSTPIVQRVNGNPVPSSESLIQRQTDSASPEASQRLSTAMPKLSDPHSRSEASPVVEATQAEPMHVRKTKAAPSVMPPLVNSRSPVNAVRALAESRTDGLHAVEVNLDQGLTTARSDDIPSSSAALDSVHVQSVHVQQEASPVATNLAMSDTSTPRTTPSTPSRHVAVQPQPAATGTAPVGRPAPPRRSAEIPAVRIGRVQVDVHAPPPPPPAPVFVAPRPAAPTTPPAGPALRRFYLRSW